MFASVVPYCESFEDETLFGDISVTTPFGSFYVCVGPSFKICINSVNGNCVINTRLSVFQLSAPLNGKSSAFRFGAQLNAYALSFQI